MLAAKLVISNSVSAISRKMAQILLMLVFASPLAHGLSIYQIGNSLTYDSYPFNQAFVQAANENGQNLQINGWHVCPGRQLNYIYDNPDDPDNLTGPSGNWQIALTSTEWDIITVQPYSSGTSTLSSDESSIDYWINLTSLSSQPTRFYLYAGWPRMDLPKTYSEQWLENTPDNDDQPTVLTRNYFDHLLSRINAQSNTSIRMIPIGEVWYRIDQHARAGNLTNLTSAHDLYRDAAHANDIGKSVVAWTMFASLFDRSAVGIDLPAVYSAYPNQGPVVMNDELRNQLQLIVDSVVHSPSTASNIDSNRDGIPDVVAISLGLDPYVVDGDTDNDGMSDLIEIGLDINNPRDSDGDGVIDALEAEPADTDPSVAHGLSLENGTKLTISAATGHMISNASVSPALDGPTGVEFPFGMINYNITSEIGGTVEVRLEFPEPLAHGLSVYKVNNQNHFTQLPDTIWNIADANTVVLSLRDGDPITDLDGITNGIIHDPITIGFGSATTPGDPDNILSPTHASNGGCTFSGRGRIDPIWAILLLIPCIGIIRRMRL